MLRNITWNQRTGATAANEELSMVIGKILSLQEHILNSSIINSKTNVTDLEWNLRGNYQLHQIAVDSRNLPIAELIIGTVTYVVSTFYTPKFIVLHFFNFFSGTCNH